MDVKFTKR